MNFYRNPIIGNKESTTYSNPTYSLTVCMLLDVPLFNCLQYSRCASCRSLLDAHRKANIIKQGCQVLAKISIPATFQKPHKRPETLRGKPGHCGACAFLMYEHNPFHNPPFTLSVYAIYLTIEMILHITDTLTLYLCLDFKSDYLL